MNLTMMLNFFTLLFEKEWIRWPFIAAILIGILAPLLGTVVVIKRLSFIADTLSHFSLAGVCIGVYLSKIVMIRFIDPIVLGVIFSIGGTFIIEKLRSLYKNYKELSMPIVLSLGVGLSSLFISLSGGGTSNLTNQLLFGNIYNVSLRILIVIVIITITIILISIFFYKQIVQLCFDETYAQVCGLRVKAMQMMLTIILAIVISVFIDTIGVLLISALLIVPVATSILIGDSFLKTIIISIMISEISIICGFVFSYYAEWPTGATIVLFNLIILMIVILYVAIKKRIKQHHANKASV
ncbi:MAG: metal ABC transporter permease [Bacilli bacterium]|nr:metal ABC transporter permease [Bacilli bacterium]